MLKKGGYVYWRGSVMSNYSEFKNAKEFRKRRSKKGMVQIEDGGWHYSYLGGVEAVMYKLRSLEHASEEDYQREYLSDYEIVEKMINSGVDLYGRGFKYNFVEIGDECPEYIINNIDRYSHLIKKI